MSNPNKMPWWTWVLIILLVIVAYVFLVHKPAESAQVAAVNAVPIAESRATP